MVDSTSHPGDSAQSGTGTGILLLAAGFGRRFGSDKRSTLLADGESLLVASTRRALASGLAVRVCLRPEDHALAQALQSLGAAVIHCPRAGAGMGATLADGIARCGDWDGVLVALGDMPWVAPESFRAVARGLEKARLCRPSYRGESGHPVGFRRDLFGELRRLEGDQGAREIVRRHRAQLRDLPLEDPGILRDIDRPADLDSGTPTPL
ncbi:nucleotidyltransferase family protein [Haliea sp. E17]|uniref:nucleotidyltransferase family protein n=1 Tax=Haliea sp. E17 TaxID=3401576 RepID=UPI003AAAEE66